MITPTPIEKIIFNGFRSKAVKELPVLKIVSDVAIPTPAVSTDLNSSPNNDNKNSISTNLILLIFVGLAIIGLIIYAVHKERQKQLEKNQFDKLN